MGRPLSGPEARRHPRHSDGARGPRAGGPGIFHAPTLDLSTTDHALGTTGLLWNLETTGSGLKRVQPNFATDGITERFDLHPTIAYPLTVDGWHFLPSLGVRETAYSRSRQTPYAPGVPVELSSGLNRADFEMALNIRPPVLERTFTSPGVEKFFGHDIRHTIEPEVTYRYVTGVNNFLNVLRFDDIDIVSDTNELAYGITQRLFLRPRKARPCLTDEKQETPVGYHDDSGLDPDYAPIVGCDTRQWISWRLTQKYFFNQTFGGAVINNRRNIFTSTLGLSGIAFLTEPRETSPIISRLRISPSEKVDVEWDFDLDTGAKKFTSNNVFADVHEGNIFAGMSYARLNAPGRFFTEGVASTLSDFSQLRLLLGYGSPSKPGLGVAANVGLDLLLGSVQYGALQASYNWNCCGLSVEYRKYELGAVAIRN